MSEMIPRAIQGELEKLVQDIVNSRWEEIQRDDRIGRLTKDELEKAIGEYPGSFVLVPDEGYRIANVNKISGKNAWRIDLPLWTHEEGRSDLTLAVTAKIVDGKVSIEIDDILVM